MFLSVFDLFKVGIGPSSSHTVGPMVAVERFIEDLKHTEQFINTDRIVTCLYGSLAFTGKGHATDKAIILGLLGHKPDTVDPNKIPKLLASVHDSGTIRLNGERTIRFNEAEDVLFDYGEPLAAHSNGMNFIAHDKTGEVLLERCYYSIGGGFVVTDEELDISKQANQTEKLQAAIPYPFQTAKQLLQMGQSSGKSIAEMKLANELTVRSEAEIREGLDNLWAVMNDCINRGIQQEGILPGGLKVKRRAHKIHKTLIEEATRNFQYQHTVMDWISLYALAVNEENAAGGRVVTAPTNGAAGVMPATFRYYLEFCPQTDPHDIHKFLLTAAAIAVIIKINASISGAEVGCQGEVGSASAMAAGGLAALLGGTNEQIENAAEIALEHHLGMTCDPIGGLVQIPCIERNAMGAVKAINAASLAMKGDGIHHVPFDSVIETMRQTGVDMLSKYKETSEGGLAVNVTEC